MHLVAFAIDVDRVRDARDGLDDALPFGWEVFLTECHWIAQVDPRQDAGRALVEDAVLGVLESEPGEMVLGTQLPFAAWDAVVRGVWPDALRPIFAAWKTRPDELVQALAPLWREPDRHRRALARTCLETELDPPLAPPTIEALRRMAEGTDPGA